MSAIQLWAAAAVVSQPVNSSAEIMVMMQNLQMKLTYRKLEDIDLNGTITMYGPVSATPWAIYGLER
jgi:hypothetical protein